MKRLFAFILVVLVMFLLFKSCGGGPAASDLHGIVAEDSVGFVGVDASAAAEFLQVHHKMADKYLPEAASMLDEALNKDFYKSMELLQPKMFAAMGKSQQPVIGLRLDDEVPFGTLLRGFAPMLKEAGLADDLEIVQPDEDENLFLAAGDDDALEAVKEAFGRKGAKLARKRLAGIDYDDCLVYGWLDTAAVMHSIGLLDMLPARGEVAAQVAKDAGARRFGIRAKGNWKLNAVAIVSFKDKDKAKEVLDGLKAQQKQGIAELKEQAGKAEGIEKDFAEEALVTLKGLSVKRSGSDVRLEATVNLKSLWKIAKKYKKEEAAAADKSAVALK